MFVQSEWFFKSFVETVKIPLLKFSTKRIPMYFVILFPWIFLKWKLRGGEIWASSTDSTNAHSQGCPCHPHWSGVWHRGWERFPVDDRAALRQSGPQTSGSMTGESHEQFSALRCPSKIFSHLPWIWFLIKRLISCISSSPPSYLYKFIYGSKWEEAGNSMKLFLGKLLDDYLIQCRGGQKVRQQYLTPVLKFTHTCSEYLNTRIFFPWTLSRD